VTTLLRKAYKDADHSRHGYRVSDSDHLTDTIPITYRCRLWSRSGYGCCVTMIWISSSNRCLSMSV